MTSKNSSDWKSSIAGYRNYLELERGLSKNSIAAYTRDIHQFVEYIESEKAISSPRFNHHGLYRRFHGFLI